MGIFGLMAKFQSATAGDRCAALNVVVLNACHETLYLKIFQAN